MQHGMLAYFEQAFNGVVARMSLMCWLLGVTVPEDIADSAGGGSVSQEANMRQSNCD